MFAENQKGAIAVQSLYVNSTLLTLNRKLLHTFLLTIYTCNNFYILLILNNIQKLREIYISWKCGYIIY